MAKLLTLEYDFGGLLKETGHGQNHQHQEDITFD